MSDIINREAALAAVADAIADGRNVYRALAEVPVVEERRGMNEGEYNAVDQFICSECGLELQGWYRVERDEDTGEETHYEYVMRYCPNCGTKTVEKANVEGKTEGMTCREWMQRNRPYEYGDAFIGGAFGCPFCHWPGWVRRICQDEGNSSSNVTCHRCWDQPCPEGGADDA